MKTYQYPGDILELRKWALNRRGQLKDPPELFERWVLPLVQGDRDIVYCGYWVGCCTPDNKRNPNDPVWHLGYPHTHNRSVGWADETLTAITYLSVAEEGGEFALGGLSPDDPYELVKPELGLTVVTDAATWHGVRYVSRGTRLALITTGFADAGKER